MTETLAALLVLASPLAAQAEPELLFDIQNEPSSSDPADSDPRILASSPGGAYLSASNGIGGPGLWFSNGTTAGSIQLSAGIESGVAVVASGGAVFFDDEDGNGREPWFTNGTPGGTHPLADLIPGSGSSVYPDPYLVSWRGEAWFLADSPATGVELWRSDGTSGGTVVAHEFVVGPTGVLGGSLFVAGDTLYVSTFDGSQLFAFADPGVSPILLGVFPGDDGFEQIEHAIEFQGELWFNAHDGSTGWELWRSDGTVAILVQDIEPGPESSDPRFIDADGSRVWFGAIQSATGRELWSSDGTTTAMVADIYPGTESSDDYNTSDVLGKAGAIAGDGRLLFRADDGVVGDELFISDGTAIGTHLVKDIFTEFGGASTPYWFTEVGGLVYFTAASFSTGRELWTTDGTASGTEQVKDIAPGGLYSDPYLYAVGNELWFAADDWTHGYELWISDGTGLGTVLAAELAPDPTTEGSGPSGFVRVGEKILFRARREEIGNELWSTDGTPGGTELVKDIWPGSQWGDPRLGVAIGSVAVFSARDQDHGSELWASDGTAAGTQLVADLAPGLVGSAPTGFVALDNIALFVAEIDGDKYLYRSDGTPGGTFALTDGSYISFWDLLAGVEFEGAWYFKYTSSPSDGLELFRTDGSIAGSYQVMDINPGVANSNPQHLVVFNGELYFSALTPATGAELWKSDGTAAGTSLVIDLNPGPEHSDPIGVALDDRLVFSAIEPPPFPTWPDPRELWSTDGTPAGTVQLLDLPSASATGSAPIELARVGDLAYFIAFAEVGQVGYRGLWRTDGTVLGTQFIEQPQTPGFAALRNFERLGGTDDVMFTATSYATGATTFVLPADGSPVYPLFEVFAGPGSFVNWTQEVFELNGRLVFADEEPMHGTEPYAFDLIEHGASGLEYVGAGCAAGSAPKLDTSGTAGLGDTFELELSGAEPFGLASGWYSLPMAAIEIDPDCYVYLAAPANFGTLPVDGQGETWVPITVPNQSFLVGARVVFQVVVTETGGPIDGLFALSDALEVVFGE